MPLLDFRHLNSSMKILNRLVSLPKQRSLLLSKLPRPLPRCFFVACAVGLVCLRDFGDKGVVGVWIGQQRANRKKYLRHGQGRTPLVAQDVKANAPIRVNVRMVDSRCERDLRRFKLSKEKEQKEVLKVSNKMNTTIAALAGMAHVRRISRGRRTG